MYVIDDDDAVRDSLLFLLDVDGLPARGFETADAFLTALPPAPAGCVITDVRMPGLDGTDLLHRLPARGVALPIIVITGHGDVLSAEHALAAGAFDFIEKPFKDSAILEAVKAALAAGEPDLIRDARARATGERIAQLPDQERAMLGRLVMGDHGRMPAETHGTGVPEADLVLTRIMKQFGADSLPELVRLAIEARRYAGRKPVSR